MNLKFWFFGKGTISRQQHDKTTQPEQTDVASKPIVVTLSEEDRELLKSQHEQVMDKLHESDSHEHPKYLVQWMQGLVKFFFGFEKAIWGILMLFCIIMAISFLTQTWSLQTCVTILMCFLLAAIYGLKCFCNITDIKKRIQEVDQITELNTLFGVFATISAMLMLAIAAFTIIKDADEIANAIIQFGKKILNIP